MDSEPAVDIAADDIEIAGDDIVDENDNHPSLCEYEYIWVAAPHIMPIVFMWCYVLFIVGWIAYIFSW